MQCGWCLQERGLVFRHTDNINQWLRAMEHKKFPETFYPEITDLYDKKNMPRVIYCVHALSRYLYQLGIAPEMEDLHGVAEFTEEELTAMEQVSQHARTHARTRTCTHTHMHTHAHAHTRRGKDAHAHAHA